MVGLGHVHEATPPHADLFHGKVPSRSIAETKIAIRAESRDQTNSPKNSTTAKSGAHFSLIYTTARAEPRLDWLIDGLEVQAIPGDEIQLIVIDALNRTPETIGYRPIDAIADLIVTMPKPSPWQGPQRLTRRDFWAASSARNTGIVFAGSDYIAFLDDRCRLGPRWLAEIRKGVGARVSVLCGAYDKIDGNALIPDYRMKTRPKGQLGCSGGWLYGGNFALPLSWLFQVNGFEEGVDGLAGEDCILGRMLANRGHRIDFVTDLYMHKEHPTGSHHRLIASRRDRSKGDQDRAAMARFGKRLRTEFTPDLRALRTRVKSGNGFPDVDPTISHLDWYDRKPIRDMT